MKLRLTLHFFQPQNSFKGAKHWWMNVSVQPFQMKTHALLSIILAQATAGEYKAFSSGASHECGN